jgi:cytochrome oxidase assembly protein ShyY1
MKSAREPRAYLKSFIALLLIASCIWAAQWQYHRGVDRHHRNFLIAAQIEKPAIDLQQVQKSPSVYEWRTVRTTGDFDLSRQILLKNRYSDGVYGFEVLTWFTTNTNEEFWVNRGWVKAGMSAITAPEIPEITPRDVSIEARLRLNSSLPRGAFYALPAGGAVGLISMQNAQAGLSVDSFYLDLLQGSDPSLKPAVPVPLPQLGDGPHMAYALQWIFFGGLIGYGRILIRRGEILTGKKLKI